MGACRGRGNNRILVRRGVTNKGIRIGCIRNKSCKSVCTASFLHSRSKGVLLASRNGPRLSNRRFNICVKGVGSGFRLK